MLGDFRAWLEAGGVPEPVEPVGLDALAAELVALRHDVQLHTKAARAAVEKLHQPADLREHQRPLVRALVDVADALAGALKRVKAAQDGLSLLDLKQPPDQRPGWLGRLLGRTAAGVESVGWVNTVASQAELARNHLEPLLAGIADGYALSLRRVERALTATGLEPINCLGQPFDPLLMEAVELDDGGRLSLPSGTVLAESRRGYRWGGEVFRFAGVTVAR